MSGKDKDNNRLYQIYYSHCFKGLASKAFPLMDTRDYAEVEKNKQKLLNNGYNAIVRELDGDSYKLISTTYTPAIDPFLYP
jgi:hypothetical protein